MGSSRVYRVIYILLTYKWTLLIAVINSGIFQFLFYDLGDSTSQVSS